MRKKLQGREKLCKMVNEIHEKTVANEAKVILRTQLSSVASSLSSMIERLTHIVKRLQPLPPPPKSDYLLAELELKAPGCQIEFHPGGKNCCALLARPAERM